MIMRLLHTALVWDDNLNIGDDDDDDYDDNLNIDESENHDWIRRFLSALAVGDVRIVLFCERVMLEP